MKAQSGTDSRRRLAGRAPVDSGDVAYPLAMPVAAAPTPYRLQGAIYA